MHITAHFAVDLSREMKEDWTCGNPSHRTIRGGDIN